MTRNIKTLVFKTSIDGGTTFVTHEVVETPTIVPVTVEEEKCTKFGDEYHDYLPTIKGRELLEVKVRDNGDDAASGLPVGCVLKCEFGLTYSDRACGDDEDTVIKDLEFQAYIQSMKSDTVAVEGNRIAAISLSLRLKTAMTAKVVGP